MMTMFLSQVRDWNEELQGCRELARNTIQERLHRERSIFKARELTDIKNVECMPLCTCSAQTVLLRSVKVIFINKGKIQHLTETEDVNQSHGFNEQTFCSC